MPTVKHVSLSSYCSQTIRHGNYDYDAPLYNIEKIFRNWINSGVLHLQMPNMTAVELFPERIEYELWVGKRSPVMRDFVGVKPVTIPKFNGNIIEFRIRLPRNEYQWQVYFFPVTKNKELFQSIMDTEYPSSVNCMSRYTLQSGMQLAEIEKSKEFEEYKKLNTVYKTTKKIILQFYKNTDIKKLCYFIGEKFENDIIPKEELGCIISEFINYEIPQEYYYQFFWQMLLVSIIEPISKDNDDFFSKTFLFDEYYEEAKTEQLIKDKQQIDREIGELIEDRDRADSGMKEIFKMLTEQNKLWCRVNKEIRAAEKRMEELG